MDLQPFGLIPHDCKTVSIGQKFGRLTVLAIGRPPHNYRYTSICKCDCGSEPKAIRIDGLTSGLVIGCGCVQKERTTKHGLTNHGLFGVHRHMMDRCFNPQSPAYPNYGGRGITVCERWHDVSNFVADLESIHKKGLEMDRIDNDGNYEPDNIRFVTRKVNSDNRRTGRLLTYQGKTQSLTRWAEEVGVPFKTLHNRLTVEGWSVERTLSTPSISVKERMAIARQKRWAK
jgi:hypothetical protein